MNQGDNGITKLGCVNHDCDKCKAKQQEPVHQYRIKGCSDWYDGFPDYQENPSGVYETRTLYTAPQPKAEQQSAEHGEPVQPVAWLHKGGHVQVRAPYLSAEAIKSYSTNGQWQPLYTAPPAPEARKPKADHIADANKMVPLTDEQITQLMADALKPGQGHSLLSWARRIERAHGIGGNA